MKLWPHQIVASDAIHRSIDRGSKSGLIVLPTGSGKTFIIIMTSSDFGWPTLIVAHRIELIGQTADAIRKMCPGASIGIIQAELDQWRNNEQFVLASVQSLKNGRLKSIPKNRFGLLVIDEAHHSVADSYRNIINHFDYKFLLGATATPDRYDGEGLADLYGSKPLYNYPIRKAIQDGILSRLTQYAVTTGTSLDEVSTQAGDFVTNELSHEVNTTARNDVIVESFQQYASDRRSLAFTVDVQHAHDLAKSFDDAGISCKAIHGNMPLDERKQILADFRNERIQIVTNCQVLTEGYDHPGVNAVIMARPTQSRSLYQQCVGRGLRRHPGKSDCLVLDYQDNCSRNKLVTCLDLFGDPKSTNANGADVVQFVDRDAEKQVRKLTVQTLRPLTWRLEKICPWPELPTLHGFVASQPWHREPATEKQTHYLRRNGLDIQGKLTKGTANYLIDRMLEFKAEYPEVATSRQRYFLKRCGRWDDSLTFDDAHKLIGELKNVGNG